MSLFDASPSPTLDGTTDEHPGTATAVAFFVIISAVGSAFVVGFILFGIWYRLRKKREQREAAMQLVELSRTGAAQRPPPQEVGVARWDRGLPPSNSLALLSDKKHMACACHTCAAHRPSILSKLTLWQASQMLCFPLYLAAIALLRHVSKIWNNNRRAFAYTQSVSNEHTMNRKGDILTCRVMGRLQTEMKESHLWLLI
jgi:hypothetical protein